MYVSDIYTKINIKLKQLNKNKNTKNNTILLYTTIIWIRDKKMTAGKLLTIVVIKHVGDICKVKYKIFSF